MKIIAPHSESVGTDVAKAVTVKVAPAAAVLLALPSPMIVTDKALAGNVLVRLPGVTAVTCNVIVQTPGMPPEAAGIVPPVSVTVVAPEFAVSVLPIQVVEADDGVAITIPLGKLSVKDVIVAAPASALLNEIVRVETPPGAMVDGLKTLLTPTPPGVRPEHAPALIVLSSSVTAPVCAKARPFNVAPVFNAIDVLARIFPMNEVVVPRVPDETSLHHTLHGSPPVTDEPDDVVSVDADLKIQTPDPLRVRFPVSKKASAQ